MTQLEKLITKFKNATNGFKWNDLVKLLEQLGFEVVQGSGSRVKFHKGELMVNLHKPHPSNEVKQYAVRQVRDKLNEWGLI